MDWSIVWKAVIALGALSFLFGALLAMAYRRFKVETDPRLDELLEAVLGSNCAACGYPGCEPACQAVLDGKAAVDVCVAGGQACTDAVAKIMGVEATNKERGVAIVHCQGGEAESASKAIYEGIDSCVAADQTAGGSKACPYGCLGLGTCRDVCPVHAIRYNENRRRVVDRERCTGCGLCVESCPRGLIELVPRKQQALVMCKSCEKASKAREQCSICCTGCRRCVKECKAEAIRIEDNLAIIDFDKCTQCGKCVEACPSGALVRVVPRRKRREKVASNV